jgi:exodeoxyribonuclease V alpha subunit
MRRQDGAVNTSPASEMVRRPGAQVLDAVLERITYANEESGYTIARVATDRSGSDLVTVVGALLGVQPGESLRLVGRWGSHPRYGRQFEVDSYTTVLPATVQGIERYLGSGLIKGIGRRTAARIVGHFGADTLRVIEEQPGRLVEVAGLGPKRTAMIGRAWEEQRAINEVMVFLQGVGVSTSLAVRIYKKFGDGSIAVVRNEPYRLAADVWGIGFKTADAIAHAVGIAHDSPQRAQAGIQYTLSQAADSGHCFLPEPNLLADAAQILGVPAELVRSCLAELVAGEGVVRESVSNPMSAGATIPAVYLVAFHRAETALATALLRLSTSTAERLPGFAGVDWARALAWLQSTTGVELAAQQERAVRLALTAKVAVLTGGPGCGKSFTVKSVITLAAAKRAKIVLAAPTGRAAKRLSELCGHPATTVHRLLQLRPGGDAAYDRDHPLDADLIVVDEVSMLDVLLANKLVKAIPPGAHLLLVGDVDQLPSVGAGEVLRDILAARGIPRVGLTQIFRQAQRSGVVVNAHRINAGRAPVFGEHPDFFLFPAEEPQAAAERVVELVARRIPRRFGIPPREIQVLAPMHRGPAGAGALNVLLQEAIAPARDGVPERRHGARVFRPGDKVIQIRNNYDKGAAGVFNGTVGTVTALSVLDRQLTVRTDEDEGIDYDFDELDELQHAYAVTVHRSQGSEYPAVVVPLTMSAYTLLQRNLLYTAVTRAKRLVVLVGSRKALAVAVRTAGTGRRHTALTHRLHTPGTTQA